MEQDGQFWSVKASNLSPENVNGASYTELTFSTSHSFLSLFPKGKDKQMFKILYYFYYIAVTLGLELQYSQNASS